MWLQEIADLAFGPIKDLLLDIVTWLSGVSLVAARGMDISRYMGYFAWLGPAWLGVVRDLVVAVLLIVTVYVAKSAWSLMLQAKEAIKWW